MTKDNHKLGQFDLTGIPPAPRGSPQITVEFVVDANGILTVSAEDKGTGKSEKVTIKAEKGRLSEEEIERMVKEAEEFADSDKKLKDKVDAKNQLETFAFNAKQSAEDPKVKGEFFCFFLIGFFFRSERLVFYTLGFFFLLFSPALRRAPHCFLRRRPPPTLTQPRHTNNTYTRNDKKTKNRQARRGRPQKGR